MNQILVACLVLSCAAAAGSAVVVLAVGWGLLFALAAYCGAGSMTLVGSTLVARPVIAQFAERRARQEAERAKAEACPAIA